MIGKAKHLWWLGITVLVFWVGYGLGAGSSPVWAAGESQTDDTLVAPIVETLNLIQSQYVEQIDETALVEAALIGIMDVLDDPFSFYMDPETFRLMNNDLQGRFEGIGATVRQDEETGRLVIVSTMPGSPAEVAGILSGDAIAAVDGHDITSLPQSEIINLIRGPKGTAVDLGVIRAGIEEMLQINVIRDEIQVPSVEAEVLDEGVAYVRLYQFGASTARDLRQELLDLDVESLPGLIVDFRGNPGGYLTTAVDVASEFLETGVVVTERSRDDETVYEADGNASAPGVPLVVLVDEGSASASELVAGALQDQGRATIIGMQTFGKGSVQTWRELSNSGGVRVTTARWYTPNDRTIDQVGLTPDMTVPWDETDPEIDVQLQVAIDYLLEPSAVE